MPLTLTIVPVVIDVPLTRAFVKFQCLGFRKLIPWGFGSKLDLNFTLKNYTIELPRQLHMHI